MIFNEGELFVTIHGVEFESIEQKTDWVFVRTDDDSEVQRFDIEQVERWRPMTVRAKHYLEELLWLKPEMERLAVCDWRVNGF